MRIIRVFPRRTNATANDELVRIGVGPSMFDEADTIHISVTFSWDIPFADRLAQEWRHVAPVLMGGPALNTRGEDFVAGKYIKRGYTITSRGCPNRCWFCSAWRRDGNIRELPIEDGSNILDDNLLACSEQHIRAVFTMLIRQPERPVFTGGLEAARLRPWHATALKSLNPRAIFFAYDTEDDYEPLASAAAILGAAGFSLTGSKLLRCYVLCGFPKDTFEAAEMRYRRCQDLGFTAMPMLWRNESGVVDAGWCRHALKWQHPASMIYIRKGDLFQSEAAL